MRNNSAGFSPVDMETQNSEPRVFLLSPASTSGVRAGQLTSPRARFGAAERYRSPEGVTIEEAFAFMSSLYFRGKITYARHFAAPPPGVSLGTGDDGILVIAPGFGLVPPSWPITPERMKKLKRTPVDLECRAYCRPMKEHAEQLRDLIGDSSRVVLLGSIATGKYVDVLRPVFGNRLVFPRAFVGAGDMKRGGLMLRAVREGEELEYATLDIPRQVRRS
jgi:hypothetical protein